MLCGSMLVKYRGIYIYIIYYNVRIKPRVAATALVFMRRCLLHPRPLAPRRFAVCLSGGPPPSDSRWEVLFVGSFLDLKPRFL